MTASFKNLKTGDVYVCTDLLNVNYEISPPHLSFPNDTILPDPGWYAVTKQVDQYHLATEYLHIQDYKLLRVWRD